MPYTYAQRRSMRRILDVFAAYLRSSISMEIVWTNNFGYVILRSVDTEDHKIETCCLQGPEQMVLELLKNLRSDYEREIGLTPGQRELTEREEEQLRKRASGYMHFLSEYAAVGESIIPGVSRDDAVIRAMGRKKAEAKNRSQKAGAQEARPRPIEKQVERNAKIYAMHKEGTSMSELSNIFGISRSRLRAICEAERRLKECLSDYVPEDPTCKEETELYRAIVNYHPDEFTDEAYTARRLYGALLRAWRHPGDGSDREGFPPMEFLRQVKFDPDGTCQMKGIGKATGDFLISLRQALDM